VEGAAAWAGVAGGRRACPPPLLHHKGVGGSPAIEGKRAPARGACAQGGGGGAAGISQAPRLSPLRARGGRGGRPSGGSRQPQRVRARRTFTSPRGCACVSPRPPPPATTRPPPLAAGAPRRLPRPPPATAPWWRRGGAPPPWGRRPPRGWRAAGPGGGGRPPAAGDRAGRPREAVGGGGHAGGLAPRNPHRQPVAAAFHGKRTCARLTLHVGGGGEAALEARHAGRAAIARSPVVGPGGPGRWPPRHVLGGPLPRFSGKSAGGRGRGGSRQGARGGAAAAAGIEGRRRAADTRAPAPSRRWDHARACVAHSPLCATPPRRSAGPTGAATRGSHAAGWREALGHRLSPPSVCHHPKRGNNGLRRQFL